MKGGFLIIEQRVGMTRIGRDERLDCSQTTLQAGVIECSLPTPRLGVVNVRICYGEHLDYLGVSVVRCAIDGVVSTKQRKLSWNWMSLTGNDQGSVLVASQGGY